jgi:hypothetical protein
MPSSADGLFEVELFEPVGPETDEHRQRLPGRVAPLPGEALGSWLLRYAEPFGLAPEALLLRSCDIELAAATEWWRRPHRALIDGLAQQTGVGAAEIGAMTFADWLGDGRSDEMPERFSRLRFHIARPVTRQMRRTSVCPRCIAEDEIPYIRRNWTLGWITACPVHGTVLVSECPDCGTKLRLPRLSSGDYFAPDRCARCAFRLRRADDRCAHESVLDLQARMLGGRDRGVFDLPGHGIIPWPVAMALFDVLLGAVWIETKPSARTRLFARIAKDIGRDELGENAASSYEGLAILAWILAGWPDRLRIAIAILRARRPRRQLERWQDLDDDVRRGVEALLLAVWPDETADPDRAWWRSWIETLSETGDDLRARADRERFPHRRARLRRAIAKAITTPSFSATADPSTAAPARSAGAKRSPNSSLCKPTMRDGSTRSPRRQATAPPPRPCRPSSTSISTTSPPSSRHAASDVTEKLRRSARWSRGGGRCAARGSPLWNYLDKPSYPSRRSINPQQGGQFFVSPGGQFRMSFDTILDTATRPAPGPYEAPAENAKVVAAGLASETLYERSRR